MASCDFEDDGSQEKQRRKSYGPRKLMRWDGKSSHSSYHKFSNDLIAEKDQLVLLTVDHVCAKKGIPIPWEEVAKEVSPNLSGEAIKQHLVKVRMYRIENDQQVPEKLEKGTRRKANLAAAANQATPVRGARAKKVKKEEAEEDATPTASKPRRGVSLLHMKESKNDKTSKVGDDTSTPSTTRRGGRKKAAGNDGLGEAAAVAAASTGKRGRKKKQAVENEEGEESNYEYDSPTKKPRTRAKPKVNYCEEQVEEDADEEVVPYDESNNDGKGAYETLRESHPHAATQDSFGTCPNNVLAFMITDIVQVLLKLVSRVLCHSSHSRLRLALLKVLPKSINKAFRSLITLSVACRWRTRADPALFQQTRRRTILPTASVLSMVTHQIQLGTTADMLKCHVLMES